MLGLMDKHFAFIITALIQRVRDFPPEALNELFRSMDRIEKKYDLIEPLTDEERLAIEEGVRSIERDGGIPAEEVFKRFDLDNYDRDAAGKEHFLDAISRVHKQSGEEQAGVADVIFALLDEYRFDDIPPPPPKVK
jgi:hypothetical protein